MPRYEFSDGKSAKFWQIERDGSDLTTTWGRIGTDGQCKRKSFGNVGEATKQYDKQIAAKRKKGYELVGEGGAVATINPALEKALIADPDDRDAALVYADWLDEQDDPRGRLITLQDQGKDKDAKKWLKKHEDAILGPLLAATKIETDGKWGPKRTALDLGWQRGFIKSAWLGNVVYDAPFDAAELIGQLFEQPVGRFLQELTVGCISTEGELYYDEFIERLAGAPRPSLRTLFIGDFESEEMELSWSAASGIHALWKKLPGLESFRLRAGNIELGRISHKTLREFRINSGCLAAEPIEQIVKAKWPQLETLEIWFGCESYDAEGDFAMIEPILRAKGLKNLTHLGLANCEFVDEIAAALPKSKILKQLKSLDLSLGTLGNEGARSILDARKNFAHLEWIDFADNYIFDEDVRAELSTLCADVRGLDRQDYYDDDYDHRYATVGE